MTVFVIPAMVICPHENEFLLGYLEILGNLARAIEFAVFLPFHVFSNTEAQLRSASAVHTLPP